MELNGQNSRFMETETIPRLLIRFAAPATIGMLASALYNIVDRIFVGHTVGAEGIAAISLSFPCMLFFFAFSILVGEGGASRIALQLGAKNEDGARRTLGCLVFLCLAGGFVSTTAGYLFIEPILRASGASDALLPTALEYLSVIIWGVFCSIASFAGSCAIRACGSPGYAMGTQLIGALLNVGLDAWFVVGLRMEVKGAAIATVISQVVSLIWVAAYFFTSHARLRFKSAYIIKPDLESMSKILAVGFPPFMVHLTFVIIHGIMNASVSKYGGDLAVSATGIFMSLDSLLFMPAVAIGDGAMPIVGYNYGAKRFGRVKETIKWALSATTVFYICSFLTIFFHTEFFVRLFNNSNEALIALTSNAMRIAYLGVPVMGISIVTGAALQGLGRARDGLVLSFIRFGLLMLLPLIIFPRIWGIYGVWGTFPLSDTVGSAVSFFYLHNILKEIKKEETRA